MKIDGPGVFVPAPLCGIVARALGEFIRRHRPAGDGTLRRLVFELSGAASDPGQTLADDDAAWCTADEVGHSLQVSPRTVHRWGEAGKIERRKAGNQWLYRVTGNGDSRSPSGSSEPYRAR